MLNRGIYENKDGSIAIIIPSNEVLDAVGLRAVMEKDVPTNLPYWLASDTDIPSDRTNRNLWVSSTNKQPDGFGGKSNQFTDAELQTLFSQGVIK